MTLYAPYLNLHAFKPGDHVTASFFQNSYVRPDNADVDKSLRDLLQASFTDSALIFAQTDSLADQLQQRSVILIVHSGIMITPHLVMNLSSQGLRIQTLNDFAGGLPVVKVRYPKHSVFRRKTTLKIVWRIWNDCKNEHQPSLYSGMRRNCEMFARYAKTGRPVSKQMQRWYVDLAKTFLKQQLPTCLATGLGQSWEYYFVLMICLCVVFLLYTLLCV